LFHFVEEALLIKSLDWKSEEGLFPVAAAVADGVA
jgi:hypothetical protein